MYLRRLLVTAWSLIGRKKNIVLSVRNNDVDFRPPTKKYSINYEEYDHALINHITCCIVYSLNSLRPFFFLHGQQPLN